MILVKCSILGGESMSKKRDIKEVKAISSKNGFEFLDDVFNGNKFKHNFKCIIDGEVHKTNFDGILRGKGLLCCKSRKLKKSIDEVRIIAMRNGFIFLDKKYINEEHNHNFLCKIDGEIHQARLHSIINGQGLKCCYIRKHKNLGEKRKYTFEEVRRISIEKGFEFLDSNYIDGNYRHNFKCMIDNKIYTGQFRTIVKGGGLKCCRLRKISIASSGANSNWWNPLLTQQDRIDRKRNSTKNQKWKNQVKKRDGNLCQICGTLNNIHVHHLENYAANKNLRYILDNGITVCGKHHNLFHKLYGKKNKTTRIQFYKFEQNILEATL